MNTHAIGTTVPVNGAPAPFLTWYFDLLSGDAFTATEYGPAWIYLVGGIPTPIHLPYLPNRTMCIQAVAVMKVDCKSRTMKIPACDRVMYAEQEEH